MLTCQASEATVTPIQKKNEFTVHKTCVSFGLVNLILQYILWKCLIHILLKNHIKIKKKRDFIDPSNNILVCWATLKKYKLK